MHSTNPNKVFFASMAAGVLMLAILSAPVQANDFFQITQIIDSSGNGAGNRRWAIGGDGVLRQGGRFVFVSFE